MAITVTALTGAADNVDRNSYATASITPSASKLILAFFSARKSSATVSTATATGNGLTWVAEENQIYESDESRLMCFRAMGASPSAGAVTFDLGGVTHVGAQWSIFELDGVDTSGTDGSGAIVQSEKTSSAGATTLTVTLAAFGSADNATVAGFTHRANEVTTHETDYTEVHDVQSNNPNLGTETEYKIANDTSPSASWASSSACAAIALEIKAAAAPAGTTPILLGLMGAGR